MKVEINNERFVTSVELMFELFDREIITKEEFSEIMCINFKIGDMKASMFLTCLEEDIVFTQLMMGFYDRKLITKELLRKRLFNLSPMAKKEEEIKDEFISTLNEVKEIAGEFLIKTKVLSYKIEEVEKRMSIIEREAYNIKE